MNLTKQEKHLIEQIHKRKRYREYHRKHKEGRKAKREAYAIRKLRKKLKYVRELRKAPKIQYDSVSVGYIPHDAQAVAFYVNGLFANGTAVKRQAPNARYTGIAVSVAVLAQCLDIEPGNATIQDSASWYRRFKRKHPHAKPIFYCSASDANGLVAYLKAHGIKRSRYILWTAHYIGKHICGRDCQYAKAAGRADATQYTTSGEKLDVTLCLRSYWRRRA